MLVVGVDGCAAGWVAAAVSIEENAAGLSGLETYPSFSDVLDNWPDANAIAVDIPIGLVECRRAADVEARAVLGPRKSSVFPAPDPRIVSCSNYWEANEVTNGHCKKGISRQSFALLPKILEVNELVRSRDPKQTRIIEIHPEVCFWALNGKSAMRHPKRTPEGFEERRTKLQSWLSTPLWERQVDANRHLNGTKADDLLDAIVAAWTAQWWAEGFANRFPRLEERGSEGLRAEIVY